MRSFYRAGRHPLTPVLFEGQLYFLALVTRIMPQCLVLCIGDFVPMWIKLEHEFCNAYLPKEYVRL